jgi:hypothetical protein
MKMKEKVILADREENIDIISDTLRHTIVHVNA